MTPGASILIIDDEPANLLLLTAYLKPTDYSVMTFPDPIAALAFANESPPDLVLLDLQMPNIDGLEVCRRLKASPATRLVPVIMVTAMDSRKHRQAALDIGADDFLSKPVDRIELIARVRSLLRLKLLMDQLDDASVAKNEFIANMSHEMRQPLNSIIGFTDILLSNAEVRANEVRLHRFLTNIQTSGNHLAGLIAGVLDLASIEARRLQLRIEEVDLKQLLDSVGEMMQPLADVKGVKLRVDSGSSMLVPADIVRLRQILASRLEKLIRRYCGTQRRDVRLERQLAVELDRSSRVLDQSLVTPQSSPSQRAARREAARHCVFRSEPSIPLLRNGQWIFSRLMSRASRSIFSRVPRRPFPTADVST